MRANTLKKKKSVRNSVTFELLNGDVIQEVRSVEDEGENESGDESQEISGVSTNIMCKGIIDELISLVVESFEEPNDSETSDDAPKKLDRNKSENPTMRN